MPCTHLAAYLGSLKVRTAKFLHSQTDPQVEVFVFLCFCGKKRLKHAVLNIYSKY